MGEIIQYEGVAYKKVDRKAKAGDVIRLKGYRATTKWSLEPDICYPVIGMMDEPAVRVDGYIVHIYEGPWSGKDHSAVADVYEKVQEPESEYEQTKRHLDHPFYKEAHECWHLTQNGQIRKGAEKYPEPFNPANWTIYELLEHAMQENVDQAHYIYGMYTKMYEMEKELQELREFRDQVHKTVVKWGAMNEPESGNA